MANVGGCIMASQGHFFVSFAVCGQSRLNRHLPTFSPMNRNGFTGHKSQRAMMHIKLAVALLLHNYMIFISEWVYWKFKASLCLYYQWITEYLYMRSRFMGGIRTDLLSVSVVSLSSISVIIISASSSSYPTIYCFGSLLLLLSVSFSTA